MLPRSCMARTIERDEEIIIQSAPRYTLFYLATIAATAAAEAFSQAYPSKPISMIVAFPAGGSNDFTARQVSQKLNEILGQPVVVENRTGAGGAIAIERVATAPPDGYTLLAFGASGTTLPAVRRKLPFDIERDLTPITLMAMAPYVLVVHPSLPVNNVKELIALARRQPGKLSYASNGVGGNIHFTGELFKQLGKVDILHVPYRGGTDSIVAVVTGEVVMTFPTLASAQPLMNSGRVKALAVTTLKRSALAPSLPTLDETGMKGSDFSGWVGLVAPAGLPKDIVQRLNSATTKILSAPEIKTVLNRQGLDPRTTTPEEFATLIRREIAQNVNLVKATGIKVE